MKRPALILGLIAGFLFFTSVIKPILSKSRTKALVQKAEGEMRSLATAMFDYRTALLSSSKRDVFPSEETRPTKSEGPDDLFDLFRFGPVDEVRPALTEPIQIVESIPPDPFSPEGKPYLAADWGAFSLILSVGPNGRLDVAPEELETAMEDPSSLTMAERVRVEWSYSPTNGSDSAGDLIRLIQ